MLYRTTRAEVSKALKERHRTIERCGLAPHLHISTQPLPGRWRRANHFAVHYTPIPCSALSPEDEVECFFCVTALDERGNIRVRWYHGKHYYGRCPADEETPLTTSNYEPSAPVRTANYCEDGGTEP